MRKEVILVMAIGLSLMLTSCDWAKDKTKGAINKTGEIVGKAGSEFGSGVYKGVKKTFENEIKISDDLKSKGLEIGEVTINSKDSTVDNVLTTYVIFNSSINQMVTIKLFNESGKEFGRLTEKIKGEKGESKYFDFIFDRHVRIGTRGNITIE